VVMAHSSKYSAGVRGYCTAASMPSKLIGVRT